MSNNIKKKLFSTSVATSVVSGGLKGVIYSYKNTNLGLNGIYSPFGSSVTGGVSQTLVASQTPVATTMTLSNFTMSLLTTPGLNNSVTATLVKNGSITSVTMIVSGTPSTQATDNTHTVSVVQGDLLAWIYGTVGSPPNIQIVTISCVTNI